MENEKVLLPSELLLILKNLFESIKPRHEILPYDRELKLSHREHPGNIPFGDEDKTLTACIKIKLIGIDFKNNIIHRLSEYVGMNSEIEPGKNKEGVPFKDIRLIKDISLFVYAESNHGYSPGIKIMRTPGFQEKMLNDIKKLYQKYYLEKDGDFSYYELEKIE